VVMCFPSKIVIFDIANLIPKLYVFYTKYISYDGKLVPAHPRAKERTNNLGIIFGRYYV